MRTAERARSSSPDEMQEPRGATGLLALIVGGTALGVLLWRLAGPPELPSELPSWQSIQDRLTGTSLASEDIISVVTAVGWLALAYLSITVGLRTLCDIAVRASDGAAWGRAALRFSDLITLPPIRRMIDGSLGGVLIVSAWLRTGSPAASAEPVVAIVNTAEPRVYYAADVGDLGTFEPSNGNFGGAASAEVVSYTVADGDSLWSIAERFYEDGSLYTRIFEANAGRTMTSGETFSEPSLIRPGWVLEVPMLGETAELQGDDMAYRVREGDSLWRIAESHLGGGLRWTEIWELNKGRDMGGDARFTDPSRIFSGWILELPAATSPTEPAPPVVQTPLPTATIVAPTPTSPPPTAPSSSPAPPIPTSFALPDSRGGGGGSFDLPTPFGGTVLAAAVSLGAVAGVALIVRQMRRHVGTTSGALPSRKHSTGDAGRVDLAARALLSALRELGFEDTHLLLVRERERVLDFTLDCAPGDADALVRSRFDAGRRLACAVDAEALSPTRVQLKLSRFQRLAGMLLDRASVPAAVLLLPVGATENGIHYLNLAATGSVLLTGSESETSQVTSAWLSSLSILHSPEQLRLLVGGCGQDDSITQIPVVAERETKMGTIEQLAVELEEEIILRQSSVANPPLIIALSLLSDQGMDELSRLETTVHRGPEHGIFTICVGQQPVDITNTFGARVSFDSSDTDQDELALTIGRDTSIILKPVEVRAQPLRRHAEPPEWMAAEAVASLIEPPSELADSGDLAIEPAKVSEDVQLDDGPSPSADPIATAAPSLPLIDHGPINVSAGQVSRQATLMVADEQAPAIETATAPHPTFEVRCFGSFRVLRDDKEVTGWTIQKARELLAYLIARGGIRVSREEAAEALWPDEPADQVGHLLSNAAYYVRKTLKAATTSPNGRLLTISEQRYQLQSGIFRVDLDAFDAHVRRAETLDGTDALIEYGRALAIYTGDFLGGESYEWADPFRRDYQRRFVTAAHQAGRLALECRDIKKAMEFYQAILDRDPMDEEASRALMRCHSKLGDVNAVRRVYKTLRDSLRRLLEDGNAEPLPETAALLDELTRSSRR